MENATNIESLPVACPFAAALAGGIPKDVVFRLAIIVKCAHGANDIWAGCRVEHALRNYVRPSLSTYLKGCHFSAWIDSTTDDVYGLPELRDLAHAFFEANR